MPLPTMLRRRKRIVAASIMEFEHSRITVLRMSATQVRIEVRRAEAAQYLWLSNEEALGLAGALPSVVGS